MIKTYDVLAVAIHSKSERVATFASGVNYNTTDYRLIVKAARGHNFYNVDTSTGMKKALRGFLYARSVPENVYFY